MPDRTRFKSLPSARRTHLDFVPLPQRHTLQSLLFARRPPVRPPSRLRRMARWVGKFLKRFWPF